MADVTTIILTKNEEINLTDCIESLRGFSSRVVVDSFSSDKTEEIAKKMGADFYQNKFINYSKQFNWGIDNTNITTKWILRLDADERLTPELWRKKKRKRNNEKILITGANSYVGTSFEKYIKENFTDKYEVDTVDMIAGTWREKVFSSYDVIYHVAGIAHSDNGKISADKEKLYRSVNTDLTIEVAKKS